MADIQFNLRIPEELKEKIKQAATESGRSINAEAQYRLEESFSEEKGLSPELSELLNLTTQNINRSMKLIDQLMARIEELETNKPAD